MEMILLQNYPIKKYSKKFIPRIEPLDYEIDNIPQKDLSSISIEG